MNRHRLLGGDKLLGFLVRDLDKARSERPETRKSGEEACGWIDLNLLSVPCASHSVGIHLPKKI